MSSIGKKCGPGRAWGNVLAVMVLLGVVAGCGSEPQAPIVLEVTTEPPGALVMIGGKVYGPSPQTIRGLSPGPAYVIAEQEGYRQTYKQVEIPEEGEVSVALDLEPFTGKLSITSDPEGAEVVLNGEQVVGFTPLQQAKIPIGEHTYELRMANYEPIASEIAIEPDRIYSKSHILTPLKAELKVRSRPSGAEIRLNEELQEARTPAVFTLLPDTYAVSVYADGYISGEVVVELAPNSSVSKDITLEKGFVPRGMILVPEGEFVFGSDTGAPDERPMRKIHLPAFYIDKYEVTNAEYKKVVPTHEFQPGNETMPVAGVSWQQASSYAAAVGKRLPTEMEWEKAARGTDGREWPWGNTFEAKNCNHKENELRGALEKVGRHRLGASPYGCMDMAGNVYEWTADWYQAYPGNSAIQTDYGQVYRVLRGGSYTSPSYDVRTVRRYFDKMNNTRADYGFRCAMDVDAAQQVAPSSQPAAASPAPESP